MGVSSYVIFALMLLLGIFLMTPQGSGLIEKYNAMPAGVRAKYKVAKLCRFTGLVLVLVTVAMYLLMLGSEIQQQWMTWVSLVMFGGTLLFGILYANTGGRFKNT